MAQHFTTAAWRALLTGALRGRNLRTLRPRLRVVCRTAASELPQHVVHRCLEGVLFLSRASLPALRRIASSPTDVLVCGTTPKVSEARPTAFPNAMNALGAVTPASLRLQSATTRHSGLTDKIMMTPSIGAKFFLRTVLRGTVAGCLAFLALLLILRVSVSSAIGACAAFIAAGVFFGCWGWIYFGRAPKP